MRIAQLRLPAVLCVLVCCAAALGEEPFELRINRMPKVGQSADFNTTLHRHVDTQIVGKPAGHVVDDHTVKLSGRRTIMRVDGKSTTQLKITVGSLTLNGQSLIEKGSVLVVNWLPPKSTFVVNDKEPEKPVLDALAELFPADKDGMPADEEIFGRKEKVQPGSVWEINAAALKKRMDLEDLPLELTSIQGESFCGERHLVENVGPCVQMHIAWTAAPARIDMQQLHVAGGSCTQSVSSEIPCDPEQPGPLNTHMRSHALMVLSHVEADGKTETTLIDGQMDVDHIVNFVNAK